jgi:rfaE bifunctional protein nucleotidyltransferase chain/domain/rfaE bifunctional protein kinase chain/domain
MVRVTVIGDTLLDRDWAGWTQRLSPEACPVVEEPEETTRPGGAALAALAASWWAHTTLVTALAQDAPARLLREQLEEAGVEVVDLGLAGRTPEKWRVRAGDRTVLRLDRACTPVAAPGPWTAAANAAVAGADAVLVADYGRGAIDGALRDGGLSAGARQRPLVWDPHPRGPAPVAHADLVTPNVAEAVGLLGGPAQRPPPAPSPTGATNAARRLRDLLRLPVAVTDGAAGAVLADLDGPPRVVAARSVLGDACGAGDVFAARVTTARAAGRSRVHAVEAAVAAASLFVEQGTAREPVLRPDHLPDPVELARRTRADGGTVVVAGGCFDLLHAGHVALLRGAARLGDCLIVCLNSDASIRALKGSSRPIVPEADRRAVLLGLECVDAVLLFDEPTPFVALAELRPHVFAKGGDYDGTEIAEAAVLAGWGGEVVLLPFLPGHSTTRLVQIAKEAS